MGHHWYNTPAWRKRREAQLAAEPVCRMCQRLGFVTGATVADHVEPHRFESWEGFITGELQSLCKHCHDSAKQSEERIGYSTAIGVDGWPVDVRHPAYRKG